MNNERNIPVEDKDSPFADETLTAEQQNYSDEQRAAREKAVSKHTIAEEVLDWLRTICIGVIAGVLIVVFVLQRDNVYGPSMMPTLNSGDVVFTQKISTYFSSYSRGDPGSSNSREDQKSRGGSCKKHTDGSSRGSSDRRGSTGSKGSSGNDDR